jgi:hypothetical protein
MTVFFAAICLDHHAPSALVMTDGGVATNFIAKKRYASDVGQARNDRKGLDCRATKVARGDGSSQKLNNARHKIRHYPRFLCMFI